MLNRCTGPPGSKQSSFEHLTGRKPKILSILPFGCRAYAVKPRAAYSKNRLDDRAWTGMNLGRAPDVPGAYHVWLPEDDRVAASSEVYFDETYMPWRPQGDRRVGDAAPTPPPRDDDSARLPRTSLASSSTTPRCA